MVRDGGTLLRWGAEAVTCVAVVACILLSASEELGDRKIVANKLAAADYVTMQANKRFARASAEEDALTSKTVAAEASKKRADDARARIAVEEKRLSPELATIHAKEKALTGKVAAVKIARKRAHEARVSIAMEEKRLSTKAAGLDAVKTKMRQEAARVSAEKKTLAKKVAAAELVEKRAHKADAFTAVEEKSLSAKAAATDAREKIKLAATEAAERILASEKKALYCSWLLTALCLLSAVVVYSCYRMPSRPTPKSLSEGLISDLEKNLSLSGEAKACKEVAVACA
mmetsp:Transcript_61398/g.132027  ORF Transcript_61398/g.132027 Transcript_61398/m.132027 type:complete len:287 (+) Transcript_61398:56-916(+)